MKFIVSNKIYDTEKSEKLCTFQKQWESVSVWGIPYNPNKETTLYRTAKGAYFLVAKFDYNEYRINVISEEQAKTHLMYKAYEKYVEMFGELEEA